MFFSFFFSCRLQRVAEAPCIWNRNPETSHQITYPRRLCRRKKKQIFVFQKWILCLDGGTILYYKWAVRRIEPKSKRRAERRKLFFPGNRTCPRRRRASLAAADGAESPRRRGSDRGGAGRGTPPSEFRPISRRRGGGRRGRGEERSAWGDAGGRAGTGAFRGEGRQAGRRARIYYAWGGRWARRKSCAPR